MSVQPTIEPRGAGHRVLGAGPGFVGCERELAELTRALAGPPAVVLVEGEARIGKTRLISEFLASPPGGRLRAAVGCGLRSAAARRSASRKLSPRWRMRCAR
jgi:hypothetical protein